jgi:hypothetical protein
MNFSLPLLVTNNHVNAGAKKGTLRCLARRRRPAEVWRAREGHIHGDQLSADPDPAVEVCAVPIGPTLGDLARAARRYRGVLRRRRPEPSRRRTCWRLRQSHLPPGRDTRSRTGAPDLDHAGQDCQAPGRVSDRAVTGRTDTIMALSQPVRRAAPPPYRVRRAMASTGSSAVGWPVRTRS